MKNYVQPGDTVSVTAPAAVSAGDGVLVGSLFGVAANDADSGAAIEIVTKGVFDLAKVSAQAWSEGDLIYWDSAADNATTTASGNTLIGVAVADAANPTSTGHVRLNGSFG